MPLAFPSPRAARPFPSRLVGAAVLLGVLLALPAEAAAQRARRPVVVVLPLTVRADSARADSLELAPAITALLRQELAASTRLRVAPGDTRTARGAPTDDGQAARYAGTLRATHAVVGEVSRVGDSLRVTARLVRARDTVGVALDVLTTASHDVLALVDDLADVVVDSVAPTPSSAGLLRRGGGPVFRPPRPPVPIAAMSLYSRAIAARAAGDSDTAARLLRAVVSAAPRWEQPKRELAALARRG